MQLLAVNEMQSAIGLEIVEKVLALVDWQLTVRKLNDPIGADNAVARFEQAICRNLEVRGDMTESGLRKFIKPESQGLYFFSMAIQNLEKAGIVERFKRGQRVFFRPSAVDESD
jgi:hypothetical protein